MDRVREPVTTMIRQSAGPPPFKQQYLEVGSISLIAAVLALQKTQSCAHLTCGTQGRSKFRQSSGSLVPAQLDCNTVVLLAQNERADVAILVTAERSGETHRDDSRLDTLFLTMPISWRGTLQQYVGRLHRIHEGKKVVRVFDYVDAEVPMLGMYEKRLKGYRTIGYEVESQGPTEV